MAARQTFAYRWRRNSRDEYSTGADTMVASVLADRGPAQWDSINVVFPAPRAPASPMLPPGIVSSSFATRAAAAVDTR
ncbi:hypothetical protein JCM33774_29020 [Actinophytocola sp. KF-1]